MNQIVFCNLGVHNDASGQPWHTGKVEQGREMPVKVNIFRRVKPQLQVHDAGNTGIGPGQSPLSIERWKRVKDGRR
jgi:hypothetical protein